MQIVHSYEVTIPIFQVLNKEKIIVLFLGRCARYERIVCAWYVKFTAFVNSITLSLQNDR
jgi:hypothetical protein